MEQRIGSSSKPLEGAGFDPAFIPGLTSPVTTEPEDAKAEDAQAEDAKAADAKAADDEAVVRKDADSDAEPADADEEQAEEEIPDGPVFEAADRRARIVADARGVRLRLDEEECEFRWDEIGAVETESPRFGKRFTITVHTPDRRWYPIEIEATARGRFKEWDEQLDAVLDAYFEDEAEDVDDTKDADGTEKAEDTAKAD